jgi:hypothetical protein
MDKHLQLQLEVKQLIEEDKIKEAFDLINQNSSEDWELQNSLILLQSRFSQLNKQNTLGLLKVEDYEYALHKLKINLLQTIGDKDQFTENPSTQEPTGISLRVNYLMLITLLLILIFVVLLYIALKS